MTKLWLIVMVALTASPVSAGQDAVWEDEDFRLRIDTTFRQIATGCQSLGFTVLAPPVPEVMQKRIQAHFLLKTKYQADAEMHRWTNIVTATSTSSMKRDAERVGNAMGDALYAAKIDPTSIDAARRRYVEAFLDTLRPILTACQTAARDPFIGTNYLTGNGSLETAKKCAGVDFDTWMKQLPDSPGIVTEAAPTKKADLASSSCGHR